MGVGRPASDSTVHAASDGRGSDRVECHKHAEAATLPLPGSKGVQAYSNTQWAWFRPAGPVRAQGSPDLALKPRVLPMWRIANEVIHKRSELDIHLIWSTSSSCLQAGSGICLSHSTHTSPTSPGSKLDPAHDGLAGCCGQALAGGPSSWRKAGLSSPWGARYSWANSRAWSMAPPRTSSMRRCCCRWNARACLVSRICSQAGIQLLAASCP